MAQKDFSACPPSSYGWIGRLWLALILSHWKPQLAFLPVESVIRERQAEYYKALALADKLGQSTAFIEFLLSAMLRALLEIHHTDQVKILVQHIGSQSLTALECMRKLGLSHRPTFRKNYLQPALEAGLIERTLADKPNSRLQKYRRKS